MGRREEKGLRKRCRWRVAEDGEDGGGGKCEGGGGGRGDSEIIIEIFVKINGAILETSDVP